MSKYIIEIDKNNNGITYLEALTFTYYFFFSESYIKELGITNQALTHIKENYNFQITEHTMLCENKVLNSGRKTEIKGLCLYKKGNHYYRGWYEDINQLKELIAEPRQLTKEYETVIAIEIKRYSSGYGCGGWNHNSSGFMHISFDYNILKRCSVKKNNQSYYEYYNIPETVRDYKGYIPTLKDETNHYAIYHTILKYTEKRHEVLKYICECGKNLRNLFTEKILIKHVIVRNDFIIIMELFLNELPLLEIKKDKEE